jgi:hypothetical protein
MPANHDDFAAMTFIGNFSPPPTDNPIGDDHRLDE